MTKICDECETVAHCTKHGCVPKQPALDKMAENARELGLDYEPSQTDWEAVAADQAMTIALLKADQPAQQQEPDAFVTSLTAGPDGVARSGLDRVLPLMAGVYLTPQPPQPSKPLTDDQIAKFYGGDSPIVFQIIRDTEAAHQIGVNK